MYWTGTGVPRTIVDLSGPVSSPVGTCPVMTREVPLLSSHRFLTQTTHNRKRPGITAWQQSNTQSSFCGNVSEVLELLTLIALRTSGDLC